MNKKSKGKSHIHKKVEPINNEPEVFVLPPNLLEKLGIKLDTIQSKRNDSNDSTITIDFATATADDSGAADHEKYVCDNVCTNIPQNNESESSMLETASLMTESVFLSPTFVPTTANMITGEVEIASIVKECENNVDDLTQGQVAIESFSVPMRVENDLLNNIQVPDMCSSDLCDNHKFHENSDFNNDIDAASIQHEIPLQESLISVVTQNGNLKLDESQEIRKTKISILKDEVVDIANMNKIFNINDKNVLTPVPADMLLAPPKSKIPSIGLNKFKEPDSDSNPPHSQENVDEIEISSPGIKTHNDTDVTQVPRKSNFGKQATHNSVRISDSVPPFLGKVFEDINCFTASQKNGNENTVNSIANSNFESIEGHKSQDNRVFTNPVVVFEANTNEENVSVKSLNNNIEFEEPFIINKREDQSPLEKRDVNDFNGSCSEIKKYNFCTGNENVYGCDLEKDSEHLVNTLPCHTNENDLENSLGKSKICLQGVEKPGGQINPDKPLRVYYNRQKLTKPKPIPNKKQVRGKKSSACESDTHADEISNTQLVTCVKTYKVKINKSEKEVEPFKPQIDPSLKKSNQDLSILMDTDDRVAEYCLCSDFGQLRYYEEDTSYEHIHFWQHKNATREPDSVFCMYVDDLVCKNYEGDTSIEIFHETLEESSIKICLYEVYDAHAPSKQLSPASSELEVHSHDSIIIDVAMPEVPLDNSEEDNKCTKLEKKVTDTTSCFSEVQETVNTVGSSVKEECNVQQYETNEGVKGKNVKKNRVDNISKDTNDESINSRTTTKRRRSVRVSKDNYVEHIEPLSKRNVKCGVCGQTLARLHWDEHLSKEHGFIAWKAGDVFDPKDKKVIIEIKQKLKTDGFLKCTICGYNSSRCEEFVCHVEECIRNRDNITTKDLKITSTADTVATNTSVIKKTLSTPEKVQINTSLPSSEEKISNSNVHEKLITDASVSEMVKDKYVNCGVSSQKAAEERTFEDDTVNKEMISTPCKKNSLTSGAEKINANATLNLTAAAQEKTSRRKSHKKISTSIENTTSLAHENALGNFSTPSKDDTVPKYASTPIVKDKLEKRGDSAKIMDTMDNENTIISAGAETTVKCAVCKQELNNNQWNDHIQKEHDYLAWKEGETSLDLLDKEQIWQHLHSISKQRNGLVCSKCGLTRKYPKAYQQHLKQCDGLNNLTEVESSKNYDDDSTSIVYQVVEENIVKSDNPQLLDYVSSSALTSKETVVKSGESPMQVDTDIGSIPPLPVKCGVCKQEIDANLWDGHIQKEHDYLAWKEGESALDLQDKDQIWQHLYSITKRCDGLICSKCGLNRKYVKSYLAHVKKCNGTASNDVSSISSSLDTSSILDIDFSQKKNEEHYVECGIKCGVCSELCDHKNWITHIQMKHDYLAWKEGEQELDLQNRELVENHLRGIVKEQGNLYCKNCGVDRKYGPRAIHKFIQHIKTCEKDVDEIETENLNSAVPSQTQVIKCGVCAKEMEETLWIDHIGRKHNYMAWKCGEPKLDLENDEEVKSHFLKLARIVHDGFKCVKCGFTKKYPKLFLRHIEDCKVTPITVDSEFLDTDNMAKCAICLKTMKRKHWKSHAVQEHYNLAWRVGDIPIDLKSDNVVVRYLKEYRQLVPSLKCKVCGISRASCIGFYAHIVTCGKTEKELEEYHIICEICNKPYVCVYKNQHMTAHREQVYARERKKVLEEKREEEVERLKETSENLTEGVSSTGRRKAAVKARTVIENLKVEEEDLRVCAKCGFEAGTVRKLAKHKCATEAYTSGTESEDSAEADPALSDDNDVSDEEREGEPIRRKHRKNESILSLKIPSLPFKYKEVKSFKQQSEEDFFKLHYTDEILFSEWLDCTSEYLEESQAVDYIPEVEVSCKIKIENQHWSTFNRFEVKQHGFDCTIFVGGAIKCLSWAPSRLEEEERSCNYLAISCHMGKDTPRLNYDELFSHKGVIQIWDFGEFRKTVPKLVMCIAHDYGTVWAMDWCPSGARTESEEDGKPTRLGLLALACSDGLVHILSVPYPTSESDKVYVKLKSVAELRISTSTERKVYQATAVSWSKQKGHKIIVVGYSDGTIALYDLSTPSPLLKCIVDGVAVYYPFHDKRDHNVSITGVDICPIGERSLVGQVGGLCTASVAGSATVLRARGGHPRLELRSPATAARFAPAWPAALLAADDTIATQAPSELDWFGCGRKWGPTCAFGVCQLCSRALVYARPFLREFNTLPPYAELKKQTIATIKTMPLGKKRKKSNDELSMLVEPLTYDEVVERYGVQVELFPHGKGAPNVGGYREPFTERYPLADVKSIAFCASHRHHRRAAVGLHAGFVLLFNV